MECSKRTSEREVHSNTSLSQKNKKNLKQCNLPSQELEKEQTKPKVSRKEVKMKVNKVNVGNKDQRKTIEKTWSSLKDKQN